MVVVEGPKIFDVQGIWGRIFGIQEWNKYILWKTDLNLKGYGMAPIPFKWYQNTSGCSTDMTRTFEVLIKIVRH